MRKFLQRHRLSQIVFIFGVGAFLFMTGAWHDKQKEANSYKHGLTMLQAEVEVLKTEVANLKVENQAASRNKLEPIRPQLVDWVYKHSQISKAMANKIVANVIDTSYPLFLLALMKTESNFNPTAVSSAGAMGLGQIMPSKKNKETLTKAGIIGEMRDVFDIIIGIKATEAIWCRDILKAKGNIATGLMFYLGERNKTYKSRILQDYFYLNYLCRTSPPEEKPDELLPTPTNETIQAPSIGMATSYIVKAGDCLTSILRIHYGQATEHNIKIVAEANHLSNIDLLTIGQVLVLPVIEN